MKEPEFFCKKCNKPAKRIVECYNRFREFREWNGECYELEKSSIEDSLIKVICAECDESLEEYEV